MSEYIFPIIGFITGGGISTVLSVRYLRKNSKLDYADKAIKFMEEQEAKLLSRFSTLEKRVTDLEKISCITTNCKKRKVSV